MNGVGLGAHSEPAMTRGVIIQGGGDFARPKDQKDAKDLKDKKDEDGLLPGVLFVL